MADNGSRQLDVYCAELEERVEELEKELSRKEYEINRLNDRISVFQHSGWNPERAVKLRRLEAFHSRFVNLMAQKATDLDPQSVMLLLRNLAVQELRFLPEAEWKDVSKDKEGSVPSVGSGVVQVQSKGPLLGSDR